MIHYPFKQHWKYCLYFWQNTKNDLFSWVITFLLATAVVFNFKLLLRWAGTVYKNIITNTEQNKKKKMCIKCKILYMWHWCLKDCCNIPVDTCGKHMCFQSHLDQTKAVFDSQGKNAMQCFTIILGKFLLRLKTCQKYWKGMWQLDYKAFLLQCFKFSARICSHQEIETLSYFVYLLSRT